MDQLARSVQAHQQKWERSEINSIGENQLLKLSSDLPTLKVCVHTYMNTHTHAQNTLCVPIHIYMYVCYICIYVYIMSCINLNVNGLCSLYWLLFTLLLLNMWQKATFSLHIEGTCSLPHQRRMATSLRLVVLTCHPV